MPSLILVHLPNLMVGDSSIKRVSYNLLAKAVANSMKSLSLDCADILVASGDIVLHPTDVALDRASRLIRDCSVACSSREIITVPGELDLISDASSDLLAKSMRIRNPDEITGYYFERLQTREGPYLSLMKALNSRLTTYNLAPPVFVLKERIRNGWTGVLGLDSAFFTSSEDSDSSQLIIGGERLGHLIDEELNCTINIVVIHHHPDWLHSSQSKILEKLNEHCHLILYSHPRSISKRNGDPFFAFDQTTILVGPITGNMEFQIIKLDIPAQVIQIYYYHWSDEFINWKLWGTDKRNLRLDNFLQNFQDIDILEEQMRESNFPLIEFLIRAGVFAMDELKERWRVKRKTSSDQKGSSQVDEIKETIDLSESIITSTDKQQLEQWIVQLAEARVHSCQEEIERKLELIQEERTARDSDKKALRRDEMTRAGFELRENDRKKEIANALNEIVQLMNDCLEIEIESEKII